MKNMDDKKRKVLIAIDVDADFEQVIEQEGFWEKEFQTVLKGGTEGHVKYFNFTGTVRVDMNIPDSPVVLAFTDKIMVGP
jgi:hypothetical protein